MGSVFLLLNVTFGSQKIDNQTKRDNMMLNTMVHPGVLIPRQHILLVSHMRANTSLFGHIIGSSPEISGYYEMHIGYYSWKSLIRQKLLFHEDHPGTKSTRYYFDKVLHNEHDILVPVLNRSNCKYIFMLKKPERTIKSICNLYKKIEPEHEFSTVTGATNYYIDRVEGMRDILIECKDKSRCYYLDAESIINDTTDTLKDLSDWLNLKTPLSPEYKKFNFTGVEKFGDTSPTISHGKVSSNKESYEDIVIDETLLEKAELVYNDVRESIMSACRA